MAVSILSDSKIVERQKVVTALSIRQILCQYSLFRYIPLASGGTANFLGVPPIISGTGKATNLKFCTHIHCIAVTSLRVDDDDDDS